MQQFRRQEAIEMAEVISRRRKTRKGPPAGTHEALTAISPYMSAYSLTILRGFFGFTCFTLWVINLASWHYMWTTLRGPLLRENGRKPETWYHALLHVTIFNLLCLSTLFVWQFKKSVMCFWFANTTFSVTQLKYQKVYNNAFCSPINKKCGQFSNRFYG